MKEDVIFTDNYYLKSRIVLVAFRRIRLSAKQRLFLIICFGFLNVTIGLGDTYNSFSVLPGPYQEYQIADLSFSPNRHFAVIVPKKLVDVPKNFLVSVEPFSVLTLLPTDAEFDDPSRRGGLVINWSKDSSAAVVYVNLKWGPKRIYIVYLPKKRPPEITNLDAEIRNILQPDFIKAGVSSFNEQFDYIFASGFEGASCWTINTANQVIVDCVATSDPKNIPPSLHWTAHFTGLWSIPDHKFDTHQFSSKVSKEDD